MILSKQLGVFLNLVHNEFKNYVGAFFQKEGVNITPEQYLVLDTLWDEGVLSQQELADITMKDKNSMVKFIDGLEAKDLVKRVPNPDDRRQNFIQVTPTSLEIKDKVTAAAIEAVNRITDGISQQDLTVFIEVLSKMAGNIDSDFDLLGMAEKFPTKKKAI